jgi:hypothetical protein
MSKQKFKSLRKYESYDDEYEHEDRRNKKDKRAERRFERALRIKDFSEAMQEMKMYSSHEEGKQ